MRYSCKSSVEYDLKLHYDLRRQYIEELKLRSDQSGCFLKICGANSNRPYFSIRSAGSSSFKYVGKERTEDVIRIQEYTFYEKALELIERNISILEHFLGVYKTANAENINELLPRAYKLPHSELMLLDDPEADEWLAKAAKEKSRYPVFDPAGLKVTAFDGTKMRSRAEALHYEAFYIYNIPSVFELPYVIDGETYRPDFTILDIFRMRSLIWEHLGNWFHDSDYRRSNYRKDSMHRWDEYVKAGFYPEVNLLLSFGTPDSVFDVQALHRKVAMIAAPPPDISTIEMLKRC